MDLLERARRGPVRLPAPLGELGGVRHLLRQRMLEGVLGDRIERLLVEELGARERGERLGEVRGRQLGHGRQDRLRELPADHRRVLHDQLLALAA